MSRKREIEVEFDEETNYIMERLVYEGRFRDKSDFVSYAIQMKEFEPAEGVVQDPRLDQRIKELKLIRVAVDDEILSGFFTNTSYMLQEYSRLANDAGEEEKLDDLGEYTAVFNNMIAAPEVPETDAIHFLDRTVELADDFWNLSEETGEGYEEHIDDYVEKYFDQHDIEEKLTSK